MIILASNSPRRKQLLALTGWDYRVLAAQVDESPRPGEPPQAYVRRLAQEKARAVLELLPLDERSPALVIAADTTVVADDEILGKPEDAAEAGSMLRRLRDRTHQVYTGLAALRPGDERLLDEVVLTEVCMRDYSDEEITDYVLSGDPLDKAGAYAIQHPAFHPVQNLQGCYANVMGLPLCHLVRLLAAFELKPADTLAQACQETLDQPCPVFRQVLAAGQAKDG